MASTDRQLYRVREGRVRIPIAGREVTRVAVSRSYATIELFSPGDPLTSAVDLLAIDSVEVGRAAAGPNRALGTDAGVLAGLLGRRVTSCVGGPDGTLDLRVAGSGRVRSGSWSVAFGDGRHWSPHVDGRVAEWRPAEWRPESSTPRRRPARRERPLDAVAALPLAGQRLESMWFHDRGLELAFASDGRGQSPRSVERLPDVEVWIRGRLELQPADRVVDTASPPSAAPSLALVGVPTAAATASPDGTLEIRLADGTVLVAGGGAGGEWVVTVDDPDWAVYRAEGGAVTLSRREEGRPLGGAGLALLVRAYLEYSATDRPDLFWAADRLRDLTQNSPEDAYDVVRELVRLAPSPYVLGIVAAGPLEDLLSDWGERIIDRLEADARADPKLMAACADVWKLYMPDEVWTRLRGLIDSQGQS